MINTKWLFLLVCWFASVYAASDFSVSGFEFQVLLPDALQMHGFLTQAVFMSIDGGAVYFDHSNEWGDLSYKLVFGLPQVDREIMTAVLGLFSQGELNSKPGVSKQLNYEMMGSRYVFAVSYVDLGLHYGPVQGYSIGAGNLSFRPLVFSAHYNGEKFGLTGEYSYQWNRFSGFGHSFPDKSTATESVYVGSTFRFIPQLQGAVRYHVLYIDTHDKQGSSVELMGVPDHVVCAKDWMVRMRWDVTPSWMLRAEYHRIEGTAWIPSADNPDPNGTQKYWDLSGLQLSSRF